MTSYCLQYVAGLQTGNCEIPLEPHFLNWAATLPKVQPDFDDDKSDQAKAWFDFFDEFGTHCKFFSGPCMRGYDTHH
jgi:hypothetical protein